MALAFLFFSILLLMSEFVFFKTKKDILSPVFIYFSIFALSALVFAINFYNWNMPFGADTMFILLFGIAMFGVGSFIGYFTIKRSDSGRLKIEKYPEESVNYKVKEINIGTRTTLIISEIIVITDIWTILDSYRISILAGNGRGPLHMLPYVRSVTLYSTANLETPLLLKQLKYISLAFAFFYILVLAYDVFYLRKKIKLIYLLPPLCETVQMVLTTGRIIFLRVIIFLLIISAIMYRKRFGWNKKVIKNFLKYAILGGAIFFVIFRLAGALTGKSSKFNFYDNICLYLGGSLPAFDDYLHNFHSTNTEFGAETFINLQRILYKLHLADKYHNSALEWMSVYGMSYNTYTALRRYFHDFGYPGLALLQAFMGFFYTRFYLFVSRKEKGLLGLLIYGFIFYPVILSFDDDLFFISVLSTATITQIFYLICIYWFFIGRKQETPELLKRLGGKIKIFRNRRTTDA